MWSLIGAVISQGSSLAASVVTGRVLGRVLFGEYGIIQSTVGMLGVFAGVGLGLTATKYVAELRMVDSERAGRIIGLSMIVALAAAAIVATGLVVGAPWLASKTLNAPQLVPELYIAAGLLFLNAIIGTQTGVLAGFEAFRAIARVSLVRGLVMFPLATVSVVVWKLPGAIAALVMAAAIAAFYNQMTIVRECKQRDVTVRWRGMWSDGAILWKFSVPAFLSNAMTTPALWAASAILVHEPHGYSEMGLFSAANQWRMAVAFLPSLLGQPLLSMLSNLRDDGRGSFTKLLRANLLLNFGLSALVGLPIILFSAPIMQAYGRSFVEGRPVLNLLIIAATISATAAVIGQAMASLEKMWWGFWLNAVWGLVLLGSAAVLIPRYGAMGLAGAFLFSYTVHAFTVSAYVLLHLSRRKSRPILSRAQ